MRTTLPPDHVQRSMRMILALSVASWGLVYLAVKIGLAIVSLIGGALS